MSIKATVRYLISFSYFSANKIDDKLNTEISPRDSHKLLQELGIDHYYETSALTNVNVTEMFHELTQMVTENIMNVLIDLSNPKNEIIVGVKVMEKLTAQRRKFREEQFSAPPCFCVRFCRWIKEKLSSQRK